MSDIAAVIFGLSFIFAMTTLGSLLACFIPESKMGKLFPVLNGFSGGVMTAAAVWSLILPSLDMGGEYAAFKTATGIAVGGAFIFLVGLMFPEDENGGYKKLFTAMTAHNVPEGIAVGFALGVGAISGQGAYTGLSAAIGIGIQNLPEGAALVLPARKIYGRRKSFLQGVISGAVEPISGIIGYFAVNAMRRLLPYLTAFSAGAMLYVVFAELSPRSEKEEASFSAGSLIGFILMMLMDVLLG